MFASHKCKDPFQIGQHKLQSFCPFLLSIDVNPEGDKNERK